MQNSTKTKQKSRGLITRPLLAGAMAVTALAAANAQAAAVDMFLKIDGIAGESQDAKHKGEIQISSFSAGFMATSTRTAGAAIKFSRPTCGPIQFDKVLDTASMPLVDALMTSKVLPSATITFRKAGKDQQEFYVVTLTDSTVSSFTQGAAGDVPAETVEFVPRIIQMKYRQQKADGSLGTASIATVDCTGGQKG